MRYKRAVIRVLLLYLIAASIPGLLGIEARTSLYSVYQAVIFCGLFLYTVYSLIRYGMPGSSKAMIFTSVYIGLLIMVGAVAILSSIQNDGSIFDMAQLLLPILLALTLLVGFGGAKITLSDVHKMMLVVVFFLSFASIYNIIINFDDIVTLSSITGSYEVDMKGFFANRNVFGFMMAVGASLAVYLWTQKKQILYIVLALVMVFSLVTAMSRGGLLFFVLSVLFYLLAKYRKRIILPLAVVAVVMFIAAGQPFVQDNIIRADSGDTGRSSLREHGLAYISQSNILTGGGQQAIDYVQERTGRDSYHNLYIETLATQGVIGALALLASFFFSYRLLMAVRRRCKDLGVYLLCFLATFVIYVWIEALPLFYGTPNSVLVTYLLIVIPLLLLNGKGYDASKQLTGTSKV